MRRLIAVITAATLVLGVVGVAMANGNGNGKNAFRASLGGYQEVPAISTTGTGSLNLTLNSAGTELAYTLTFSGLSGNAAAAHIHFAQPGVNGGIVADLCGGTKPACPAAVAGTVSGVITSANILASAAAQGITAGEFAEVLKAMRAGVTYANVHTGLFSGGEIRGQIRGNGKNGNDDD